MWSVYKNGSCKESDKIAMSGDALSSVSISAELGFVTGASGTQTSSGEGGAVSVSAMPPLRSLPRPPQRAATALDGLPPLSMVDSTMPASAVAEARKQLALSEATDNSREVEVVGVSEAEKEKSEAAEKERMEADKKKKWTAVIEAVCAHFKPKKIFRVIASEGKALQAKAMMVRAMDELRAVCLFDLTTNTIIAQLDKEEGFMKPGCLPFHMLALACLLQGETLSIKIFEEIVELWEQIKAEANKDLDDHALATTVLVKPLNAHAGGAYIKYHALLFLNSKKCLCPTRGQLIRDWVASLKMEVKIYKIKYLKEIENEMNQALARLVANTTTGELAGNLSDEGDDVY